MKICKLLRSAAYSTFVTVPATFSPMVLNSLQAGIPFPTHHDTETSLAKIILHFHIVKSNS